jgi:Zn-dependent protease
VDAIGFGFFGAFLKISLAKHPAWKRICVVLGGCCANLLFFFIAGTSRVATVNLQFGLCNLIPLLNLDGNHAMRIILRGSDPLIVKLCWSILLLKALAVYSP